MGTETPRRPLMENTDHPQKVTAILREGSPRTFATPASPGLTAPMCGRYRIKNTEAVNELIRRLFGIPAWVPGPWSPRYNIAPSQELPVLALGEDGQPNVSPMRWGLIPSWEKDDAPKVRPINAQ